MKYRLTSSAIACWITGKLSFIADPACRHEAGRTRGAKNYFDHFNYFLFHIAMAEPLIAQHGTCVQTGAPQV